MAVILVPWDVVGEVPAPASGFVMFLVLAGDVVFLVWYRRRFLRSCRSE